MPTASFDRVLTDAAINHFCKKFHCSNVEILQVPNEYEQNLL